jgi:type II secretory pathway pseudopilin PulG
MTWELLAIWAIVTAAIIWFVLDERQQQRARNEAQAQLYAAAAQWRHRSDATTPPLATAENEAMRRRFIRSMMSDRPVTTR